MKNPHLIALGKKIRSLRIAKDFTQESFADAVDLHPVYYGRVERGECNISLVKLIVIAKKLKVPISELVSDIDKKIVTQNKRAN